MNRIRLMARFAPRRVLPGAAAQVTVEVTLDQDQFLPGEAIITAVRITNRSGQTLRLGAKTIGSPFPWNHATGKLSPAPAKSLLPASSRWNPAKVAIKRVNLAPYFSANLPGRYSIIATVRIKDWHREIVSEPRTFDVIQGAKLWEQEFGVPNTTGPANPVPEVRKYILQQANYLKSQLRLYLRLTDASGAKAFRVIPIGPMVSFGRPEPQVDKFSRLHILYQDRPHSFNYTIFNPDGELILRRTYDYVNTRPRLQPDGEGNISVKGGVRRVTHNDWPPPPPDALSADETNPPTPPVQPKPPKP